MLKKIFSTDDNYALTVLRVTLGLVMLPHGAQKLLGWFGGYGYDATMAGMSAAGFPKVLVFLLIFTEFFGALALIFGAFGRVAALGMGVVMAVAALKVHWADGFFMNWASQPGRGEGFEYHLLYFGAALAVMIAGSGAFSVDRVLARVASRARAAEPTLRGASASSRPT
jgi:putative oxidoreductase